MLAQIRVYLQTPLAALHSDAISRGIASTDWWVLGESIDMTEDAVERFMQQLRWNPTSLEFTVESERRPIQLSCWTEPERIQAAIDELAVCEEMLVPARVRLHLASVCSIVTIELGWMQLQTLYEIVAFEIAYWLAEAFQGVILSPDDQWYDHNVNRWKPVNE